MRSILNKLYIILMSGWFISNAAAQVDTDKVVNIGRNAITFKDYVLAIQYFNTAIRYSPENAEPYFYRGLAKFSLDDFYGAEMDSDSCIIRNPFIYRAYFLRALARHSLGKDSLALRDYEMVLRDNPDDQGALHNASLLYISNKDTVRARQSIDRLKRFHANYAPAYVIDGGYYLAMKDTVQAKVQFLKGIEISPTATAPYVSLAAIAYDEKDYRTSLSHLDKAIELSPDNTDLYTNRGLVRFKLNNLRGAMSDYSTAITIKPNNLLARYNRALLRTRVGDLNDAISDFDVVLTYDPDNSFARFNRALIHNELGSYDKAKRDLDIIVSRYPTFVPAYMERANAKRYLGDSRGADIDMYMASQLMNNPQVRTQAKNKRRTVSPDDDPETMDTRDERDENIRKFRMLVYDGKKSGYNELYKEEEGIRGRVQDRQTRVEPEPMYILSYYDSDSRSETDRNNVPFPIPSLKYTLKMVRQIPNLTESIIREHQSSISSMGGESEQAIFTRAMDYMTLKDYQEAASLFAKLIVSKDERYAISARFQYASCLMYTYMSESRVEQDLQSSGSKSGEKLPNILFDMSSVSSRTPVRARGLASDALSQLEQLLTNLSSEPAQLLYNIGCIHYNTGNYRDAISYFARAIQQDSSMGAAYFNKALCHYALGEKGEADRDMSMAGSLGLYKAYSILKRMQ